MINRYNGFFFYKYENKLISIIIYVDYDNVMALRNCEFRKKKMRNRDNSDYCDPMQNKIIFFKSNILY